MTGVITGCDYQQGSGIAVLHINNALVPCDAGPTFRALRTMFGGTLSVIGQEVEYETDSIGVLLYLAFPE